MKRRAHTTGKGKGAHSPQTIYGRKIKGPVRPVVSTRKHGKQIKKKISIYERIWRILSRLAGGKAR